MLTSDFSRKAHANFPNHIFVQNMFFFQHIDVKSTSISRKIEAHIESNFHFRVSIDVFNHFNATNIKNTSILDVHNTTTYSYLSFYLSVMEPLNPNIYKLFDGRPTPFCHVTVTLIMQEKLLTSFS